MRASNANDAREILERRDLLRGGAELKMGEERWGGSAAGVGRGRRLTAAIVLVLVASLLALLQAGATWGAAGPYDPAADPYSMASLATQSGVTTLWKAGVTGAGVDVALIDTGVTPVEGLATAGKVVYGPDLSLESQSPNLRNLDTNGHGTFMAGLIAGQGLRDPGGAVRDCSRLGLSRHRARRADRERQGRRRRRGRRRHAGDRGDRLGRPAQERQRPQHPRAQPFLRHQLAARHDTDDPLSFAVEQAWKKGIVVVAAAGNSGYQRGKGAPGLADPAYNPYVIAAGGYDTKGTRGDRDDVDRRLLGELCRVRHEV